jgi:hypothetical protein
MWSSFYTNLILSSTLTLPGSGASRLAALNFWEIQYGSQAYVHRAYVMNGRGAIHDGCHNSSLTHWIWWFCQTASRPALHVGLYPWHEIIQLFFEVIIHLPNRLPRSFLYTGITSMQRSASLAVYRHHLKATFSIFGNPLGLHHYILTMRLCSVCLDCV